MTRQALEKNQVFIYLIAISCGLIIGMSSQAIGEALKIALWPILSFLLYVTFTQVPFVRLREAFVDPRMLIAATVGNFVLIPFIAWILMILSPNEPPVRLGVLLVLLVPCTDWFITFSHLGGGDTKRSIAFAPISLLLQIFLLPFYLWLFLGKGFVTTLARIEMLEAFVVLILIPLIAAFITEKWAVTSSNNTAILYRLAWLPVPLLAMVVFIIAASQVTLVIGSVSLLSHLLVVFSFFLIIAAILSKVLAIIFRLPPEQGRILAFSFGTRNSFVVLPLALSLPSSFELAVVVIVFQSLVELFGMIFYLWWVPKSLFPKIS